MEHLWVSLSSDGLTLPAIAITAVLALIAVGFVLIGGRAYVAAISRLTSRLTESLARPTGNSKSGRTEQLVLDALRARVTRTEPQTPRVVIDVLDDAALDGIAESLLAQGIGRFVLFVGENLTAIALVITFSLLGLVLTQDVTDAIRSNTSDGAASMRNDALVHAFAKMGGKFFISAVGLLGGVVFRGARDSASRAIQEAMRRLLNDNQKSVVPAARYRIERAAADREALHAVIAGTADKFAKAVSSIDVSVKDIGLEVSTNLGKLMRESLAEELAKNLSELRVTVETISTHVEKTFTSELRAQVADILRALEAVRVTIHERAGGEVELT